MKQKPLKEMKDVLFHANKMKLFTLNTLYEALNVKSGKQKKAVKESLQRLVKKRYISSKGNGVYMPIFKRDKSVHGIPGYENPKKDFYIICQRFEVEPGFKKNILDEAEAVAFIPQKEIKKRKDFREDEVITIDGADAKDLDDAVFLKREKKGYRLFVHIADVSFYVKENRALDKEAYQRGTSIYLVDRVVPMLPKVISNGICSLNPDEDKLTLSIEMVFDEKGEMRKYKFHTGIIRSKRRFTYKEVADLLDEKEVECSSSIKNMLFEMQDLASLLREKRFREGSIDFDIPELKIICDQKSRPVDVKMAERYFSHMMIEEFMLAANRAVAMFLEKEGKGMFRVHEEPDEDKIGVFLKTASMLGHQLKPFENSVEIHEFLKSIQGSPESYVLNTLLLRSMQQAYYHHENVGHFGLGFSHYTHFTSPIRRYPDLVVHRLIKKLTKKDRSIKHVLKKGFISDAALHSSKQERQAVKMERAIQKRKGIHYLKDKIGKTMPGVVSGITENGIYVALTETGIEGMVVRNLLEGYDYAPDFKEYHGRKKVLALGVPVKVRLISMNLKRELIDFQLMD